MSKRGRFITLEGGEGVGKSTNVGFVAECLEAQGLEVVRTREPGGTVRGEAIRALLLDPVPQEPLHVDAELLLMFAARHVRVQTTLFPALARGAWVVCDRFTDATFAYQGGGRGIPKERIAVLENFVQQGLSPDLTLLLDMPKEAARQRLESRLRDRHEQLDRFEQEQADFFQAVRDGYLARAEEAPERFAVIDAQYTLDKVQSQIRQVLLTKVAAWR